MKKYLIAAAVLSLSLFTAPVAFADSNVTASAGTGAFVSPVGTVFVVTGTTQTFITGAQTGFTLSGVSIDGVSQGAVGSVDVTGDLVDHTVDVSAFANASIGGGPMLFCSGPMAPGYRVGIAGGGCGGTAMFVPFGTVIFAGSESDIGGSIGTPCAFLQGCMIKE